MNAADRIALVDRLARAINWNALSPEEQAARRRDAELLIVELEIANEQRDRLGWIFVDTSTIEDDEEEARRDG
jgi:hypothetical protein